MGIGIWELIFLLVLLAVAGLFIAAVVWFANRAGGRSSASSRSRPAAERLAELESLHQGGRISDAEYEKHRAAIISSV
jgi:hypothetical protein